MHRGEKPSRRNDVEGILYTLLYLFTDWFPYTKCCKHLSPENKNNLLYTYKLSLTNNKYIEKHMDNQITHNVLKLLKTAQNINYSAEPNYKSFKEL